MLVYVSLRQLLLYQMGYLLFHEMDNGNDSSTMQRLQTLQTAFEQLKSYQHNTYYHSMISNLSFEMEDEDIKELEKREDSREMNAANAIPRSYIHPFGFGMWIQEQSFVNLTWTGTMDDSETTKDYWRELTGKTFIKKWKKKQITDLQIINIKHNTPYTDISIPLHSCVKASQFRISLCRNRIFKLNIPDNIPDHRNHTNTTNTNRRAPSYFCAVDGRIPNLNNDANSDDRKLVDDDDRKLSDRTQSNDNKIHSNIADRISGLNLFNLIDNAPTLQIVCCILFEATLASEILTELMENHGFNVNGKHTVDTDDMNLENLLQVPSHVNTYSMQSVLSDTPSMSAMSVRSVSVGTAYSGANNDGDLFDQMTTSEIYNILMNLDYSDKKNPVKYEWKLMVDALCCFQCKICLIDEYSDADILEMTQSMKTGLTSSVDDQRSGLIKVACSLFVLISKYRSKLFLEFEFFQYWMLVLLRKCANRDRIRTEPAHNACNEIISNVIANHCSVSSDNCTENIRKVLRFWRSLWCSDNGLSNIDQTWMKAQKSATQYVSNFAQIIGDCDIIEDNSDVMQIGSEYFDIFNAQSHKEVRHCAVQKLLYNLYKLDDCRAMDLAKKKCGKSEFLKLLKEFKKNDLLKNEKHLKLFQKLNSKKTAKKGKSSKKKKNNMRSLIEKAKQEKKKKSERLQGIQEES